MLKPASAATRSNPPSPKLPAANATGPLASGEDPFRRECAGGVAHQDVNLLVLRVGDSQILHTVAEVQREKRQLRSHRKLAVQRELIVAEIAEQANRPRSVWTDLGDREIGQRVVAEFECRDGGCRPTGIDGADPGSGFAAKVPFPRPGRMPSPVSKSSTPRSVRSATANPAPPSRFTGIG